MVDTVRRDSNGKWVKGTAPNAGGRPRRALWLRERLAEYDEEFVEKLMTHVRDTEDKRTAVKALEMAMAYRFGRPMSQIDDELQSLVSRVEEAMNARGISIFTGPHQLPKDSIQ